MNARAKAIGTSRKTNGRPMMVIPSAIEQTSTNGRNSTSAASPMMAARTGSAAAARPTRATGARATSRIRIMNAAIAETRNTVAPRLSHRPVSPSARLGRQSSRPVLRDQSPSET